MPQIPSSIRFHFTETEPTPLLRDFESFCQYLERTSFALGKSTGFIPYKHLAALNEAMMQPNRENHPRTAQEFYPQLHLRTILPRDVPKKVRGNYVFKVSVAPKIWRTLALSSDHTLDALHGTIQTAFEFDSDHLYAFYMDNRWYGKERFESPNSGEGPSADEVEIGELGLTPNPHSAGSLRLGRW